MRYSGLNIGVMGIFYEPLQRCDINPFPQRLPNRKPVNCMILDCIWHTILKGFAAGKPAYGRQQAARL